MKPVLTWKKKHRLRMCDQCMTCTRYTAQYRNDKYIQNSGGEKKGRDHLREVGIDGRIILKWS
jgi:hypothetical protein